MSFNDPKMYVYVPPGTVLVIRFADDDGEPSDGEFQVHCDTQEHPNNLVVKETAGLPGSILGGANEILYRESWQPDENAVYEATGKDTMPRSLQERIVWLVEKGYFIGPRPANIRPQYNGCFIVCESELLTKEDDGECYCVVGDDMTALVNDAYDWLYGFAHD